MLITGATHLSLRQPTQSKADAQKPSHFSGDRPSCHITTTYLNRPSVNQQLCLRHTNARARACTCTIRPNLQKSLLRQCEFTASSQMIFTALLAKPSLSACWGQMRHCTRKCLSNTAKHLVCAVAHLWPKREHPVDRSSRATLNREQYYVLVLEKKTNVYKLSGATIPVLTRPLSASLWVTRDGCAPLIFFFF